MKDKYLWYTDTHLDKLLPWSLFSFIWIHVARNIECKVSKAKYYGEIRNEEHIFI